MSRNPRLSAGPPSSYSRHPISVASRADTIISGTDSQSLRTLDQLSTARASVTMLDKLWTQIDVLDDVKKMAEEVKERGSFFSDDFNSLLGQVKESQLKLLDVMNRHHVLSEKTREQQRHHSLQVEVVAKKDEEGILEDSELKKKKMHDFFYGEADANGAKRSDFDELDEYVRDVRDGLTEVGRHLKSFDDTSREIW